MDGSIDTMFKLASEFGLEELARKAYTSSVELYGPDQQNIFTQRIERKLKSALDEILNENVNSKARIQRKINSEQKVIG
jgi:hypothetical protein